MKKDGHTIAGTNIEEVKQRNAKSGLSYNELKAILAQNHQMEMGTMESFDVPVGKPNNNQKKD